MTRRRCWSWTTGPTVGATLRTASSRGWPATAWSWVVSQTAVRPWGHGHGGMPTAAQPLGADTGDVIYPAHLINGRLPAAPVTISSTPGRRIRLRIINAGSDTPRLLYTADAADDLPS